MSVYVSLARFYDSLTHDVPYGAMADYYEVIFAHSGSHVQSILDTACGTGTLTCLLAERGYDMIGVDASPEMLAVAAGKSFDMVNRPMFINQPLERLDLYGTVDAAICSLDGMNYIRPDRIGEALRRIRLFLEPGGIFIFDINTRQSSRALTGKFFSTKQKTSTASGAHRLTKKKTPAATAWISLRGTGENGHAAGKSTWNTHTKPLSWKSCFLKPVSHR
jgi:SAM-dependent methyltransferase